MNQVKTITVSKIAASLVCGIACLAAGISNLRAANIPPTATTALQIVSHISMVRTRPPTHAPTNQLPDGPLMGNGSLGVALQGKNTNKISLYLSRNDFWSVLRGRIMPMGQLMLSIPQLTNGAYRTEENIGPADITGQFTKRGGYALAFKTWVANPQDLVILKLTNTGSKVLAISASLLDGWRTSGAVGMSHRAGSIDTLRVSPDTVDADVGKPSGRDPAGNFHGQIADVKIYNAASPPDRGHHTSTPRFRFLTAVPHTGHPTGASTCVNVGFLAMPEKAFTVTAWVYPQSAKGRQAIFSAMTSDRWQHWGEPGPNPPQISYGFTLSLFHGRPSAMLNRVRVTTLKPLPLHQWSLVTAVYNGRTLRIGVNHHMEASTNRFPPARDVVGPGWDWNAIHPGDRKLPFDGCSPSGLLACRIIDGQGSEPQHTFNLLPGGSAFVAVSAMDDRDTPGYRAASLQLLSGLNAADIARLWKQHLTHWAKFWSASYVKIPDKTIQSFWYGSLYLLGCSMAPGHIAPGLWGNFITSPYMGWNGDYTLDYNYEAPFWAVYPTHHVQLADNYDRPLLDWMKRGEGLARHRHYHGLFYYCHLSPLPGWSADGAKTLRQKSDALFGAVNCVMRWRYTRNPEYARKVYPFLRGVATFWDHYLVNTHGVYVDENDAADELHSPTDVNPATSIAFLQMLYRGLLSMNRSLHLHDRAAVTWRHISRHLSPLPIFPAARIFGPPHMQGKSIIAFTQRGLKWMGPVIRTHWHLIHPRWNGVHGSSAGMNPAQVIFPGWAIGLQSPRHLLRAARDTVQAYQIWYDYNDTNSYYPAAADVGYNPNAILHHLGVLIAHCAYPSFAFQMGGGGEENFATVPTTICSMLMQSYQKNIILFPDWPVKQNAAFGHLLACGDFLVSSRIHSGRVAYVKVIAQRGGMLRIVNPWPHAGALLSERAKPPIKFSAQVIRLRTTPGEVLIFRPGIK